MGRNTMPVANDTDDVLCLFVEPLAVDYWLKPGETFTLSPDPQDADVWFDTSVSKGCLTVWLYEDGDARKVVVDHVVVDADGNPLPVGHQSPDGQRYSAAGPVIE